MFRLQPYLFRLIALIFGVVMGASLIACGSDTPAPLPGTPVELTEQFRPQYHFSPLANWMNDPNGLIYTNGEYHLFYQHHPEDVVWGPMHWGHAVSPDLVSWTHLPIALYPDENGAIFSGSAVVDVNNSAGFGAGAMVAVFTHNAPGKQSQSLAYSLDNGRSWTKYASNPVLLPPHNIRNFRDPKVIWHDDGNGAGHWVMMVAGGNIILFFTSPDLKNWESTGGFGLNYGETGGFWETPDLFQLPIDGGPETRWLLTVGVQENAPAGGSGTQYFIGQFDGQVFTSDNPKETILWADYGADFYAAQGWTDAPGGTAVWVAWLNNWRYADKIPTSTWRGALTLPRTLSLRTTPEGIRLVQTPLAELENLRGKRWSWEGEMVTAVSPQLSNISGNLFGIIAEFPVSANMDASRFGLRLHTGPDQQTTVGYVTREQKVFVDRTQSGSNDFSNDFAGVHIAPLSPIDGTIRLHIFVDGSSVELFGNDGLVTITDQIFPDSNTFQIELFSDDGDLLINRLDVFRLNKAEFRIDREDDAAN